MIFTWLWHYGGIRKWMDEKKENTSYLKQKVYEVFFL